MRKVTFITAFPEFLECFLAHSVIGRAVSANLLEAHVVNLRDFAVNRYGQVDDYAFGSGGMVLMAEPLARAVESLAGEGATVVYPSPQGVVLSQELVESLAAVEHLVLVCGHYEGVDERFVAKHVGLEVSLGDFVLTGGELPSMVLVDAVARLVPGVVGRLAAVEDDSFYRGMLDHPHFTRPAEWRGQHVPAVLVSGDAAAIREWRRDEAVARTIERRPDLLSSANIRPYLSKRPYLLVSGEVGCLQGAFSQLAGLARLYDLERIIVVETGEKRRQDLSASIPEASKGEKPVFKFFKMVRQALHWVSQREDGNPFLVGLETQASEKALHWMEGKRRILESKRPLVLGFSEEMPECEMSLAPLRGGLANENQIDCVLMLSVFVDRFFGCR